MYIPLKFHHVLQSSRTECGLCSECVRKMADATCVRRAKENNHLNINTQRNLAINDIATPQKTAKTQRVGTNRKLHL
jgi:hypothetical protein